MGPSPIATELLQDAERDDLTMDDLVNGAQHMLEQIAPKQTRYKVSERPDVRTIRYYISQGLLPKPVSYEGGRARYAWTHLIRLLLIKKLQAEHHTLRRIADVLGRLDDAQVVQALLPEETPVAAARAKTSAPATESATLAARPMRRVTLSRGATLDVPEHLLQDPAGRRALADDLESLARQLRQTKD